MTTTTARRRFLKWMRRVSHSADDIHIDELLECEPHQWIAQSLAIYDWAKRRHPTIADGRMLRLAIPLKDARKLDVKPPKWEHNPRLLSGTPPSFYLMTAGQALFLQREVFSVPVVSSAGHDGIFECWRSLDDPPNEYRRTVWFNSLPEDAK